MVHACSLQVCPQFSLYPQKLNEVAASLFVSCEEAHVSEGVSILNELIIPCMHLMNNFEISKEDLDAIEVMRNRWCSYLGREDMDGRTWLLFVGRAVWDLNWERIKGPSKIKFLVSALQPIKALLIVGGEIGHLNRPLNPVTEEINLLH